MKKLMYKVFALLLMAGFATSCLDDALEVESQSAYDASVVYSEYTLAEYTIFSIGEVCGHTNSYRGRLHLWYGFNTDIEFYSSSSNGTKGWETDANISLAEYNTDPNNKNMNTATNGYNEIVAGIERANIAIQGLREYGNTANDKDMAYLLGEALTYRAFFYSELIKMWGEVPLRVDPVGAETIYINKTDRDVIYKQILADLEEAIDYLYWPYEAKQTMSMDRMNKAFAKGLYARVAMMASGYAWRPDAGQAGTGNIGSLRLTTDAELSKDVLYPKALQHLKDIFEKGCLALEPDYETLWRKFNNSEHLTGSSEVMWVIPFSNSRGRWNYTHAYAHSADSEYTNGVKRGGSTGPNPTLWWKYEKQDVRRDMTCIPWWYNVEKSNNGTGYELRGRVNYWYWGKYRFEWQIDAPYNGGNDCGVKPIVMRLSDVYLMAAELAAYAGDIDAARAYLLPIRERAYKGNEAMAQAYVNSLSIGSAAGNDDAAIQDYNTEGTIMKAIIDERALELAGEMHRKQDLIRWGLLKTKLDEAAADLKALAQMTGDYAAYLPYAEEVEIKTDDNKETLGTTKEYSIFWRKLDYGVEIFGLEKDEIGRTPADWTETEPNGWEQEGYISERAFFSSKNVSWGDEQAMRWTSIYRNDLNDPWQRSVWPMFSLTMSAMQGALVNDYGYAQY